MYTIRNRAMLIGNIGLIEELKLISEKNKVLRVSLATNDSYKDANGNKMEDTTWHNLVLWNSLADYVSKYSKRGTLLAVSGKIVNRHYEDSSGMKKYIHEIRVDEVTILANGKEAEK